MTDESIDYVRKRLGMFKRLPGPEGVAAGIELDHLNRYVSKPALGRAPTER